MSRTKGSTVKPPDAQIEDSRPRPHLAISGSAAEPRRPAGFLIDARGDVEIGRSDGAIVEWDGHRCLLPDALASSRHARVTVAPRGWRITDLHSTNGTFVDGVRVSGGGQILRDGAVIFVGQHVIVFRLAAPAARAAIDEEIADPFGPVATSEPDLALACRHLRLLAAAGGDLLLSGETGTGKEVYARAVHRASGRTGPFHALNCAAIPRDLIESELFGFTRGAHSQARAGKTGLLELAEGGTLFLDEIGEMPSEAQAKLLRFVQDRMLTPLGGVRAHRVDARVIAATNREVVAVGGSDAGLRADLAARLGARPVRLPPLRDRVEDVGALCGHFLPRGCMLDCGAFQALHLHNWPGNVRELEKTLEEAVALARRGLVSLAHLPTALRPDVAGLEALPPPAPAELSALLREHAGNVRAVALALGCDRKQVYRWVKKYSIAPADFRAK